MAIPFKPDIEPTTDAEYEAAVDHYMDKLKQMLQDMNKDEDRRRSEAHRAEFDATMAKINKTLDAIAADRRLSYPSLEERQDNGPRSADQLRKCKLRRKVS